MYYSFFKNLFSDRSIVAEINVGLIEFASLKSSGKQAKKSARNYVRYLECNGGNVCSPKPRQDAPRFPNRGGTTHSLSGGKERGFPCLGRPT